MHSFVTSKELYVCECVRCVRGHAVAQLVEALGYKPEGRGFDFHCDFF
jgi:hypothetical protein